MEEGLKLTLTADAGSLVSGINDATKSVTGFHGVLEEAKAQMATFREALKKATDPKDIDTLSKGITFLQSNIKKLEKAGNPLKNLETGGRQAESTIAHLDTVIREAPHGMLGLESSVSGLVESFLRLRTETGSTSKAFGALGQELTGAGGIALGIGIALPFILELGESLFGAGEKAKEVKEDITSLSSVMSGVKGDFEKAFTAVNSLTKEVELAKNGFINKDEVVKQYNKTIGETIGQVKTLDEVEKKIASSGQAYIQFTLLKAAANEALKRAADRALEAEIANNQKQPAKKKSGAFVDEDELKKFNQLNKIIGATNTLLEGQATAANKDKEALTDIANKLFNESAAIAKKFKFDFFDGTFNTKVKEVKIKPEKITLDLTRKIDFVSPADFFKEANKDFKVNEQYEKFLRNSFENIQIKPRVNIVDPKINLAGKKDLSNILAIELGSEVSKGLEKALQNINVESFTAIGKGIAAAISGGDLGSVFSSLFSFIGDAIAQLGQQMIALSPVIAALKVAIKTLNPALLLPAGIGLVAIGSALKGLTVKGFADGGLVYGPTLGLIGEGRGTNQSNPEVIAPLDKLRNIIGGSKSPNVNLYGNLAVSGDQLKLLISRTDKRQGRIF